jgi:hypothetical protein
MNTAKSTTKIDVIATGTRFRDQNSCGVDLRAAAPDDIRFATSAPTELTA